MTHSIVGETKQSVISSKVDALRNLIDDGHAQVKNLHDKLGPILSPCVQPEAQKETAKPTESVLANQLDGLSEKVSQTNLFLADIIARIQC